MNTINVSEGEMKLINKPDILVHLGVNSCLTFTAIIKMTGSTNCLVGGHAVMFPVSDQLKIDDIYEFIYNIKIINKLFIIGDVETWYQNIPSTKLKVNNFIKALGQNNVMVVDLEAKYGTDTYDITFDQNKVVVKGRNSIHLQLIARY